MSPPATMNYDTREDRPRYQPLLIVLVAVSAGILIDSYWAQAFVFWCAAAVAALSAWYLLARRGHTRAAAISLMFSLLVVGAAWHHLRWNLLDANDLGNFAQTKAQPIALEALVLSAPRPLPSSAPHRPPLCRFEISALAVRDRDTWQPVTGRAIVYVQEDLPPIEAGDHIRIFGSFIAPSMAHNPGEFDRAAYLRAHRVRTIIEAEQASCISIIQPGSRWSLWRWLERVRKNGSEIIQRYLDPRQAELAAAVFLGQREQIDAQRNEAFMATGTIHILSISGLHVGILAGAMLWFLRRFPTPQALNLLLVTLITALYAMMVDVNPPVVRATILVLITCLSLYLGRPALSFNSLAAAALVVLAINPSDLFSTGAQLSFLSVAAIMWVWHHGFPLIPIIDDQDRLRKMEVEQLGLISRFFRKWGRYLWDLALMGAVIWALTQPLVMARFHLFSPIALVLNAVLWLPMTLGLLSGFVFLFLGVVLSPLAGVAAWCCNFNLWLLEKGVSFAAAVPGSHFWVPGPENWWLAGFYGGVFVWAAFPRIRPPRRWCVALLASWIALGFAPALLRHDNNRLHCTFLAVGHGCAVVLELPSGKTLLYDAGQFGSPERAGRIITDLLWSRGISRIDAVVLSHADTDHYNALPEVLKKCSVGVVYVSPMMFKKDTASLKALKAALQSAGVPVREISAGGRLEEGGDCRLEVLYPPGRSASENDNADSLVLMAEYLGHRIILPGDLESPGLDELLAQEPRHCDVLLAPHHGSKRSNSPGLAAWCRPDWVVLSGDGRWSTPEIDATYQAISGRTIHTFKSGAVDVNIDKQGIKVETFLEKEKKRNRGS